MFTKYLGDTMEVYIDDMLIKSLWVADHTFHLEQAFTVLDFYQMKLNPKKCTFGVLSGQFLRYLVMQCGIEAHPQKIKAILNMLNPSSLKEVQRLARQIMVWSIFISHLIDKYVEVFKVLKNQKSFERKMQCMKAFEYLKAYLASFPILSKPIDREELYIYLVVSDHTSNSVLVWLKDKIQRPIYYVNKALKYVEARYSEIEKLTFTIFI